MAEPLVAVEGRLRLGDDGGELGASEGSTATVQRIIDSPFYGFPPGEECHGGELGAIGDEFQTPRHGAQPMGHRTHEVSPVVVDIMSREDGRLDPTPVINRTRNNQAEVVEIVAGMAREFAKALENRPKGYKGALPIYEGNRYEDPEKFLNQMEDFCRKERVPEEEWGKLVSDQFKVEAYKWYEQYKYFGWSYDELRVQLIQKFDGEGVQAKLQAELYGARQAEEEDVVTFIARKVALLKRLRIAVSEEGMIRQIRPLIRPDISLHLVGVTATSVVQLTAVAGEIVSHLRETRPAVRREPRQEVARVRQQPAMTCYGCGGDHFVRNCPRRTIGPPRAMLALPAPEPSNNPGNESKAAPRGSGASPAN